MKLTSRCAEVVIGNTYRIAGFGIGVPLVVKT